MRNKKNMYNDNILIKTFPRQILINLFKTSLFVKKL